MRSAGEIFWGDFPDVRPPVNLNGPTLAILPGSVRVFFGYGPVGSWSTDQTEFGVVAEQRCNGLMLAVGLLKMIQILLQGLVVDLDQKGRGHRRVIPADVVNELTFIVHERTTFSGAENSGDQYLEIGRPAAET